MKTIIYHGPPCWDGFASAYVAHKALTAQDERFHLLPYRHNQDFDYNDIEGEAIFLDVTPPLEVLTFLKETGTTIIIADHHKSAIAVFDDFTQAYAEELDLTISDRRYIAKSKDEAESEVLFVLDMDKSGCMLAHDLFFGKQEEVVTFALLDEPSARIRDVPLLLQYVQDRDLWRWRLPKSQAINAFLRTLPFEIEAFGKLLTTVEDPDQLPVIAEMGDMLLLQQQRILDDCVKHAKMACLYGGEEMIPIVNTTAYPSEVGHALLQAFPNAPYSVSYIVSPAGRYTFSLRSRKGGFDVSALAKRFDGGGHAAAAGFTSPSNPFFVLNDA